MARQGMSASHSCGTSVTPGAPTPHSARSTCFVQVRPCPPGVLPVPEPQRTPPHLKFLVFQDLTFEEDRPGLENILQSGFVWCFLQPPFLLIFNKQNVLLVLAQSWAGAWVPAPWLFLAERPLRSWPQSTLALVRARGQDPALYRKGGRTQSRQLLSA